MHIEHIRPLFPDCAEKLVQQSQSSRAEVSNRRVKINGMNGNNCRTSVRETFRNFANQFTQIALGNRGLHLNCSERMQHPLVIEIWSFVLSRTILCHSNSGLEPRRPRILICPEPGSAGT